jgi:hypothetical protein
MTEQGDSLPQRGDIPRTDASTICITEGFFHGFTSLLHQLIKQNWQYLWKPHFVGDCIKKLNLRHFKIGYVAKLVYLRNKYLSV